MTDEKKPPRIPVSELFMNMTNTMNRSLSILPAIANRYFVVRVDGGRRLYLKGDDSGLVWFSCQEEITADIMRYVHIKLVGQDGWGTWIASTAEAAFKFWANFTKPIEMPASWLWKDDPGLTFHRAPFTPKADASLDDCPMFKEMLDRADNAGALMTWIGSIFDPDSDLQQYVWIYGHGNDGKGSLARFLTRVLASATIWQQPPQRGDKFWTHGIMGKRLVVYGDCNEAGFVTSGIFKSMTGGDLIRVEEKGGPTFSVKMQAKHMFLSNKRPTIDGDRADQRRIIYCEMKGVPEDQISLKYEDGLWNEGAAFLGCCIRMHKALEGRRIPVEGDASEQLASMKEEELLYAAQRYFDFSPANSVSAFDFHGQCRAIGFASSQLQRRLYDYLNREFGVKKIRRGGSGREWAYTGLTLKSVLREARERERGE